MFTVLSRRESGSEKCPRCSRVNVDFVDLGEDMLACFDCGSVFLTKKGRVRARVIKPEIKIEVPVTAMEVGLPGEDASVVRKRKKPRVAKRRGV